MSNLVNEGGAALFGPASVSANATVAADVNAAVAAQAGLRLVGYSSKETAGIPAAATFRIIHGATGATNAPVVNVNHAASTSNTQWFGPDGIACPNGLSIDWLTGQVDVELFYKVVV